MDNFKSLEQWREEQERIAASNDFVALWQWLVILGCIALACYNGLTDKYGSDIECHLGGARSSARSEHLSSKATNRHVLRNLANAWHVSGHSVGCALVSG